MAINVFYRPSPLFIIASEINRGLPEPSLSSCQIKARLYFLKVFPMVSHATSPGMQCMHRLRGGLSSRLFCGQGFVSLGRIRHTGTSEKGRFPCGASCRGTGPACHGQRASLALLRFNALILLDWHHVAWFDWFAHFFSSGFSKMNCGIAGFGSSNLAGISMAAHSSKPMIRATHGS